MLLYVLVPHFNLDMGSTGVGMRLSPVVAALPVVTVVEWSLEGRRCLLDAAAVGEGGAERTGATSPAGWAPLRMRGREVEETAEIEIKRNEEG